MPGERKSNLLVLVLMLAMPAAGQNVPISTTVLNTTSAEITSFSVVTGSAVDFLFTVNNVGNTNISVFPEITVYDSNNNTIIQLIYNTQVNMSPRSLEYLNLRWNTNNKGSFTAKLVVFYDNNSKSATASKTFMLTSAPGEGDDGGSGSWAVTPAPTPESTITPAPAEEFVQPMPQQIQPAVIVAVAAATASTGILTGILTGIIGLALPEGAAAVNTLLLVSLGSAGVLLFILKLKRYFIS